MVRLADLPPDQARSLRERRCPDLGEAAFVHGPPLSRRRLVFISSAGLRLPEDRPFDVASADYRLLPLAERHRLVQDHINASHDRTGFARDLNTVLPLDRALEMVDDGTIGSLADLHYAFMGASDVRSWEPAARELAGGLRADGVDTAVLCPV